MRLSIHVPVGPHDESRLPANMSNCEEGDVRGSRMMPCYYSSSELSGFCATLRDMEDTRGSTTEPTMNEICVQS